MKSFIHTLAFLILCWEVAIAQPDCNALPTGFIPINDLGKGTFINFRNITWQGGLYPGGSNFLPSNHKMAGMQLAAQVKSLDLNGNPDAYYGKIVWLSIGMSNTTQETQQFISLANAFQNRNPKLILVDGAQGGMTAGIVSTPGSTGYTTFWSTVSNRLTNAGVSVAQVQVVWLKEADAAGNTPIRSYYDSLVVRNKRILNEIKTRYPNVKLCYLSSRISGRYASSTLNPEPYAYYSGWAVKKVIGDQINGDQNLQYSGSGANSPWIAWGPYMWSDGSTPQSGNPDVFWNCPADFQSDGTHPSSPVGARKAGTLLLNFFSSDSTATSWFLKSGTPTLISDSRKENNFIKVLPTPFLQAATLQTGLILKSATLTIYGLSGLTVRQVYDLSGNNFQLFRDDLPAGFYILRLTQDGRVMATCKMAIAD